MGLPQSQLQPKHAVGYGQTRECRENLSNDPWKRWWINRWLKNNIWKSLRGAAGYQPIWLSAFTDTCLWSPPNHTTLSSCCTTSRVREGGQRCQMPAQSSTWTCAALCLLLHMEAVLFSLIGVVTGPDIYTSVCVCMWLKLPHLLSCLVHLINWV